MDLWFLYNIIFGLVVPALAVLIVAVIFINPAAPTPIFRLLLEIQLCLYCTSLVGSTFYDVHAAVEEATGQRRSELQANVAHADAFLYLCLLIAGILYGVTLGYTYQNPPPAFNKALVAVNLCAVIMVVTLVFLVRFALKLFYGW
jgi:hypothetical protein